MKASKIRMVLVILSCVFAGYGGQGAIDGFRKSLADAAVTAGSIVEPQG